MTGFSTFVNRLGDQVEFARVRAIPAHVATGVTGAWHVPSFAVPSLSDSIDAGCSTTRGMATKPPTRPLGTST